MAQKSASLEKAAESHVGVKPKIKKGLEDFILTDDARKYLGKNYQNYYQYWQDSYSEAFFDMSTMIQLGSAVETALRDCYKRQKGHSTKADLVADPDYGKNAFQRIQPWQTGPKDAATLLDQINVDLSSLPGVLAAREVMLHRHLYAHSVGVVDQKYLDDWKRLTGDDLAASPRFQDWEQEDKLWFDPLKELTKYINSLRNLVTALPLTTDGTDKPEYHRAFRSYRLSIWRIVRATLAQDGVAPRFVA